MNCGFLERDIVFCGNPYQRLEEAHCFHSQVTPKRW
jgi:hypothetical protein